MGRQRVSALVAAGAVVAGSVAGSAGGGSTRDELIRPNLGIGRVTLGMSFAEVKRSIGAPFAVNKRVPRGPRSEYVEYAWDFGSLRVGFVKSRGRTTVVLIATTLRNERTRSGVGVGSTKDSLVRRLGAQCVDPRETANDRSAWYRDPTTESWNYCSYGSSRGRRTVFLIGCTERGVYRCPGYAVQEVIVRGAF